MNPSEVQTVPLMGTLVTVEVVSQGEELEAQCDREEAVGRAIGWFRQVEETCNRFDPASELCRLSTHVGVPVGVSPLLFEAVQFALAIAKETGGAFDPAIGHRMEERGFNRDYRSGQPVHLPLAATERGDYRHVRLDRNRRTISLERPLVLDLGAVAKGLAVDMAARELGPFRNFAIDAGGDLYLGGCNALGHPWSVGIRHPREPEELLETVCVSNRAVCTSGDYERRNPSAGHHILDPRTGGAVAASASVTVIAPSAMVADGLATAAFVLGPIEGIRLLERHGVEGFAVTPDLQRHATPGMRHGN